MTCIVGFKKDDRVYIGGDTCGSDEEGARIARGDLKVFENDGVLFGCSSSFRGLQLLHHALKIPDRDPRDSDMKWLVVDLVDAIRECFKEHGALKKEDEEEESVVSALIGYRGKLYCLEGDFNIGVCINGYDATGCGDKFALGVMHYFKTNHFKGEPKKLLTAALDAASTHHGAVAPPYTLMAQSEDGEIETL